MLAQLLLPFGFGSQHSQFSGTHPLSWLPLFPSDIYVDASVVVWSTLLGAEALDLSTTLVQSSMHISSCGIRRDDEAVRISAG